VSRRPRASGYFRTGYTQDLGLIETRTERTAVVALAVILLAFPFFASSFLLDLANQVFLACIGALALMLLTGYAGQVSLGHAGLMAAGAFTVGILFKEVQAPFLITLPAAAPAQESVRGARSKAHGKPSSSVWTTTTPLTARCEPLSTGARR